MVASYLVASSWSHIRAVQSASDRDNPDSPQPISVSAAGKQSGERYKRGPRRSVFILAGAAGIDSFAQVFFSLQSELIYRVYIPSTLPNISHEVGLFQIFETVAVVIFLDLVRTCCDPHVVRECA